MPRVKVPRKSTSVDMTAMCDVAFLLLSFFILTTKFKPTEALEVVTPNSVASKVAPGSDLVLITIDNNGKVFYSLSEDAPKREVIENVNEQRNLGLTDAEITAFTKAQFVGVPFSKLKGFLKLNAEQQLLQKEGIPVTDSANNELTVWMNASYKAFQGQKLNLLLKGDNNSKYPSFKGVIAAFKKNDLMKFQMVTNPQNVPVGSELYKRNVAENRSKAGI
ncbi:MAG: biopolymer transporter ExbD [Chitinophagaceae bacterium]|nr:biopolymer transporter ExbD [Chitinophagaceae bacterium]